MYPANMKQILFLAIIILLLISPVSAQKSLSSDTDSKNENSVLLAEDFSFLIQDFKMNHQSEVNNLNIKIRVRYENGISDSKYPDFRAIVKDIEDFLNNYPNKVDYWEISSQTGLD